MARIKYSREKKLWLLTIAVVATIFSTLFIGQPLLKLLEDQNVQALFFLAGLILVAAAMLTHAVKFKAGNWELATILGIAAVYLLFFLRLGLPERSHLIEYSVLAILIHMALMEKFLPEKSIFKPAIIALISAISIGVLDELLQIPIPNRVFDPEDIFFNGFAAFFAIGSSVLLQWIRTLRKKRDPRP